MHRLQQPGGGYKRPEIFTTEMLAAPAIRRVLVKTGHCRSAADMLRPTRLYTRLLLAALVAIGVSGCTSPREYFRNHFKVGPEIAVGPAPTAPHWIDAADERIKSDCTDLSRWWTVFNDPVLESLIASATSQNLSLREAGFRILEARAQLAIAAGNLFPQTQQAFGSYQREAASQNANTAPGFGKQFFDQYTFGFNLSWELDFWGRFRRAINAADDTLDATYSNYDQVLVTLQSDVAVNYVQIRTLQQRMDNLQTNIELQSQILQVAERRLKAGAKGASDAFQARSNLAQTQAQLPVLQFTMRQASNRLCVLLGMPPTDLEQRLGIGPIPSAPSQVAIGIPAELLSRRPDVRRAQYLASAQGEQIGIAQADLYPILSINGILAYQSQALGNLFTSKSLAGTVGPTFQWNILNYGRIRNNVRVQDAEFNALVAAYQETVLRANAEVETGVSAFLRSQERAQLLDTSVTNAAQAVAVVSKEYSGGAAGFYQVALIQLNLVAQRDLQAQAHGEIAQGLIQIYRALGGGWEIGPNGAPPPLQTEVVPAPAGSPPAGSPPAGSAPAGSPELIPPLQIPPPTQAQPQTPPTTTPDATEPETAAP